MEQEQRGFSELIRIMKRLRAPDGCPWDRKQTFDSLCPHIVEEAYELVDAIHRRDELGMKHVLEECGDLLLQVIFVGTMAEERGDFNVGDIPDAISDKLIRRHPHVFGDKKASNPAEALANWEEIKRQERSKAAEDTSVLAGVPRNLPPDVKAFRLLGKAAGVGFDWDRSSQREVLDKVHEELGEVEEAIGKPHRELAGEIGDLLFIVINLARRCDVDPGEALSMTNAKFERRFRYVEKCVAETGKEWHDLTLDDLESFWKRAKNAGL